MPKVHKPRKGSLQYWPRSRAARILPSVNWNFLQQVGKERGDKRFLGLICYKAGMLSVLARDLTPNSMTRNREIVVPATVVECPPLRIFSIRMYKEGKSAAECVVSADEELKRKLMLPKKNKEEDIKKRIEAIEKKIADYDDMRVMIYSVAKKTSVKKAPDLVEIGLLGSLQEKLEFAKQWVGKDIGAEEIFSVSEVVDVHGVTKGKGLSGPVKRFGIGLKGHKSEKGVRRPGSLGPWTPKRVSFRAPLSGQLGYFSRTHYNNKILGVVKPADINPKQGFHNYGLARNLCLLIKGSIQGPQKRPLLITAAARPSKKIKKQNFEILKILK